MRQNIAIFVALFLVLTLGLWGQYELSPARFRLDFPSVLYEVVMLFGLEGEWTLRVALPWQLEFARILAPLVSVAGLLIVLTRGAWVGVTNTFIRFWRDHIIVVGLSERGWQFVQTCQGAQRVVVLERNPDNPWIERLRIDGVSVVIGDALVDESLRAVNVAAAKHLVTFCGNDGDSVEIALKVREYLSKHRQGSGSRLRIHLHVNATRVSSLLEHYSKFYTDQRVAEVDFFSEFELTARILLRNYPPDRFAQYFGQSQVHIAVFGFDALGKHILVEAVRMCHFMNSSKLRFSIFDNNVAQKTQELISLHPNIETLCRIDQIEMPYLLPLQLDGISSELLSTVTEHVICLPRDDQNLELALMLRAILIERQGCNAPINVRVQRSTGLAKLLEATENEPEIPDGIFPFGMLDETLFYENVLGDRMDELAQAMHEEYLARRSSISSDDRLNSSLKSWQVLPEPQRKSSRLQADHLAAKLRAINCRYTSKDSKTFKFTHAEAEILARMEHNRWRANATYEGWKHGSERIDGAKINPYNIPWEEMAASEQEAEIEAIIALPKMLSSRLGLGIQRELYIGVTGHRADKLDRPDVRLDADFEQVLEQIVSQYPERKLIFVSPLAEGADRVFAKVALDKLGMALHVALPLPYELYQTDFSSDESLQEFKALVGRAENYYEMPTWFGNVETLASHINGEFNDARDHQYALANAYITQTCDELIAVYDGKPVSGNGGKEQVIESREGGIPSEYRFPHDFCVRPKPLPVRMIQAE